MLCAMVQAAGMPCVGVTWTTRSVLIQGAPADDAPIGWTDWVIDGDDLVIVITPMGARWCWTVLSVRVPKFRERTLASVPLWNEDSAKSIVPVSDHSGPR